MAATTGSSAVADAGGSSNAPFNVETITQPVAETSRRMYRRISDGAHWYAETWEDVFVEAKHLALGGVSQHTAADILAGLAATKVVSDSPGRMRIRLKELRWQEHLAAACSRAIGSLPGIKQVEVSTVTGSILVHYDTTQYPSSAVLLNDLTAA